MVLENKTFNFLSILTGVVVLAYVGSTIYAMVTDRITWETFATVVGSPASMLLGYWVRGEKQ